MKKRILSLAVMLCLVFSLAACGGDSSKESTTQETATEESTSQETTEDTSGSEEGVTLEDYFNSDAMQALVESTKEQYEEQGITAAMYAEGDELKYDFTVTTMTGLSEEELAAFSDALAASMESAASTFQDTADQAKEVVTNDTVTVVVSYFDGDGNVLYTQSFTAAE